MSLRPDRVALFPLNLVLFPGERLPLHIFEPRYRAMLRDCLVNDSCFGIVLALPDGIVRVGCTARIAEVVKRYADGRFDILTEGGDPFRVLELFQEAPLLEGHIDYLEDEDSTPDPAAQKQLIDLYEACHTLFFSDIPQSFAAGPGEQLSYAISAALPLDLRWKQQILELRSEALRQDRLLRYLREWAPHLQQKKTLQQRAGGNGQGLH